MSQFIINVPLAYSHLSLTFLNYKMELIIPALQVWCMEQINTHKVVTKKEEVQDGGRVRRRDHLPPHRYIRNTSTCATAPTEHLLNAGRRPQTSQKARNSPHTWAKEKKKKQRQKTRDGTCTSARELWRRKGFHTLRSPFAGGDCGWQRGELRSHGGERSNRGAEGKVETFPHRG